jgi:5-methylcytosine-specific restriction enzyme A
MPLPRACIGCGTTIPAGSRCTPCTTKVMQAKRQARPYTARERDRRARAVDQWVSTNGWLCPGWQREPHASSDLTADHVEAVAAGGDEDGPLRVLCRRCNSARGAKP